VTTSKKPIHISSGRLKTNTVVSTLLVPYLPTDRNIKTDIQLKIYLNNWRYDSFESSKIAKPSVFQDVLRDIGKSFQSAITAPRIDLTGYGNATAQNWISTG